MITTEVTEIQTTQNLPTTVQRIVSVLDAKKAKDIRVLHVAKQTVIADYFIICESNSKTHVRSLCGEVEFQLAADGISPSHIEGYEDASWVLMDYASVVVHIFNRETRAYYHLEKLWEDAETIDIEPLLQGPTQA